MSISLVHCQGFEVRLIQLPAQSRFSLTRPDVRGRCSSRIRSALAAFATKPSTEPASRRMSLDLPTPFRGQSHSYQACAPRSLPDCSNVIRNRWRGVEVSFVSFMLTFLPECVCVSPFAMSGDDARAFAEYHQHIFYGSMPIRFLMGGLVSITERFYPKRSGKPSDQERELSCPSFLS